VATRDFVAVDSVSTLECVALEDPLETGVILDCVVDREGEVAREPEDMADTQGGDPANGVFGDGAG